MAKKERTITCRIVPPADPVATRRALKKFIQTWAALATDILLDEARRDAAHAQARREQGVQERAPSHERRAGRGRKKLGGSE